MIIYLITNQQNGKKYIGQTSCTPEKRWQEHVYNSQGNPARRAYPLYHAIRKYGKDAFTVSALYTATSQEELNQKEIEFIIQYQTLNKDFGYNRHEGGNCPPASTPESRVKAANSNRGQKRTEETKQKMSESALKRGCPWAKNFKPTEEHKEKISKANKDRCAKLGGFRLGMKSSPEHIEKIRIANTGKKHSEETKRKISESKTNPSDETRQKLRDSHLGHKPSEETRRKMSESQKKRHQKPS